MTALRATAAAIATATALGTLALPASAQVSDDIVINIMRECAKIDDPTARLACYDNNIRSAGANPRPVTPGQMATPQGGAGAVIGSTGATGFGREDVRTPQRFETPAGEVSGITATVTEVSQFGPGLYRFALQDGAVWEFTDSVARNYRVPRSGSEVEIDRASLGSFLMRYDNQSSVRVRRVR